MCKHDWKLISETTTESKSEHFLRTFRKHNQKSVQVPWSLVDTDRKHIQTFACSKCGKFKRFVENI